MSKEEENTQTAGDEQADVETTEEETGETNEDTQDESKEESKEETTQDIDYKAIANEERERREKSDKKAADLAFKLRDKKRTEASDDDAEDDEDKPLTRSELNEALKGFSQTNEKSQQEVQAKQLAKELTSNDDEADAAFEMWKNRIIPTGDARADMMFAVGGLNHKRVLAINEELKRSLKSKQTVNKDASGDHKNSSSTNEPKMNGADAASVKASGMKWNNEKKVYSKKLKDGKAFYYDPASKKRWKE